MKLTLIILREEDALWSAEALPEVRAAAAALEAALRTAGYRVVPMPLSSPQDLHTLLKPFAPKHTLIFNWYEGAQWGAEDLVEVTSALDDLGYAYTGSGGATMLMTQDKTRAKHVLSAAGIPTPAWLPILGDVWAGWNSYPAIVKVASEHGSDDLSVRSVVRSRRALRERVAEMDAPHRRLMVSEFVEGREFCVSIWGNDPPEVLPLVEIDFSRLPPSVPRVRTFASKWDPASAGYRQITTVCPARLPRVLQQRVESAALRTYQCFGMRDYGRIDIRLRGEDPQVIDVNPNPDISADASFVASAATAGYDYAGMLDQIVRFALQRAGRAGASPAPAAQHARTGA